MAELTADAAGNEDTLHCYRHPDRETYVRCGRCDRPICPRCAMQGPVGFRCRSCGKPAYDPLSSFTARQLLLGTAVSIGAGTLGATIGLRLGFLSICVGFFAGGLIADAVMRVTGYKRGPLMVTVLLGGIAVGVLLAALIDYAMFASELTAVTDGAAPAYPLVPYLFNALVWGGLYIAAAMAGAWGRLRF